MTAPDLSEGVWTFYDSWEAFPLSRLHEQDKHAVGELRLGLDHPDGGTLGEFMVKFYGQAGRPNVAARLEAFMDSWQAIASHPRLITTLASLVDNDQRPTVDKVKQALVDLGFVDETAKWRRDDIPCPTCHGKGVLS